MIIGDNMNNEMFLKQYQNLYESLQYFSINENKLILNYEGTYTLPLINVSLVNINPNLFILKPNEIFHIIRALELLYKKELNENDIIFLKNYIKTYLALNDKALEGHDEYINELNGFQIPICLSYDPYFTNNPTSIIIQEIVNEHSNEFENGKSKHPRLVLANKEIINDPTSDDILQAGFSTLILIFLTVAATCLFIYQFIFKN